jgi:hypothetical protein
MLDYAVFNLNFGLFLKNPKFKTKDQETKRKRYVKHPSNAG